MIKLCKNLFYEPKYGNVQDSMMLKRLFSTVTIVLVCLAAISFSAYAYFTYSITSAPNKIQTSSFSASIMIESEIENNVFTQGYIQNCSLEPGKYTVTISTDSGITGTGFYTITVGSTTYHTQQLGVDLNTLGQKRTQISFMLEVHTTTDIVFDSHWGTSSHYSAVPITENAFYIMNSDPLQVIVVGTPANSGNTPTEDAPNGTTPEGTSPATDSSEMLHVVQAGESLVLIAEKYNTTYPILAAYNNIENPRIIHPGDKLIIPPADWVIPEKTTSATEPAE